MSEKIGVLIDVENSQGLKTLRDTDAALAKLGNTTGKLASSVNPAASRMDALAAAQSKAKGSAAELSASHRELTAQAYKAGGAVGALNQQLSNMRSAREHVRGLTGEVDALGNSFLKVGAGGAAVMGLAVKESTSLSRAMGEVSARTRASAEEMANLKQNALDLGNDKRFTSLSAADVGRGQAALAQGGLKPGQITGGASESAAALAIVGGTDMVESAELVVDVMRTFKMEAGETMKAADALASAANDGGAKFGELAYALRMGGGAAQALNRPMTETIGVFTLLNKHMLRGSDAGTAYKTFMLNLVPTTDAGAEAAKRYGVVLTDQAGNFKSMTAIAQTLQTKLGGLSDAEQTAALKTMFGNDAYRVAAALMEEGAAGVQHFEQMVSRSGAAVESATRMQEGLHGALDALQSTAQTAANVFGDELAPSVISAAKAGQHYLEKLGEADSLTAQLERKTFALGTVLAIGAGLFFKGAAAVTAYRANLAILRTTSDAATVSQSALNAKLFGIIGIATVAGVAMQKWSKHLQESGAETWRTADGIEKLGGGYEWLAGKIMAFVQSPAVEGFKLAMQAMRWEVEAFSNSAFSNTSSWAAGGMGAVASSASSGIGGTVAKGWDAATKSLAASMPAIAAPPGSVRPGTRSKGGEAFKGMPSQAVTPAAVTAASAAEAPAKLLPGTAQGAGSIGDAAAADQEIADSRRQYEDELRQAQIDKVTREGAGQMATAEAGIYNAQQGRSLAGKGQGAAAFGEHLAAQEAYWKAREETAQKLADITGETAELERIQLENARERSQFLDDEIGKQRQIADERKRAREEAEAQAKAAKLQKSGDAATLAGLMSERAKIQGKGAQTQAALEEKAQAAQLAHAAELARQGQMIEAERIQNDVLRDRAEGSQSGKDALREAVIGGDMGRINDILQQAHRGAGGKGGGGIVNAIEQADSDGGQQVANAVSNRIRREAEKTARLINRS